ncbi:hypothetical protein ATI02_3687 [Pseudomonas baetica]|uniref:Uncharacterized protein n=1 Tax=Pseudomonas baetica TaxID=674054 RepID=A0ABX4Q1X3_9PSED|nr:hypothetical protein [Pseudomonas baetica]PKA70763.1 hypothetical protein ATI02_3687 [Pseudomonas baetica]
MTIVQTYKEGVITQSCAITVSHKLFSFIKVKPDGGGAEVRFMDDDDKRYESYPVGSRIKYVLINGNATKAEGFNY